MHFSDECALSKPLLTTESVHYEPPSLEKTDLFINSIYHYYRQKGLGCIVLDEFLKSLRIFFLAFFISYLSLCVNFDWPSGNRHNRTKFSENEIFIPAKICLKNPRNIQLTIILIGILCSFVRLAILALKIPFLLKIKRFMSEKLKINSKELYVTSWERIEAKLIELSKHGEFEIILDELICHNMVMRHTNFIIAMINCDVLNFHPKLPLIGQFGCFTNLMEIYLYKLFFPYKFFYGGIFATRVKICELYHDERLQHHVERILKTRILIMAIVGMIISPFLFAIQLIYIIFEYAEMVRQSPSSIFKCRWARFAYYSLRNYSEYDHELEERLDTAYPFANSYIQCFSSPLLNVVARHVTYFSGAFILLFLVLTLQNDSFLQVKGVLTTIALTTAIYAFGNNCEVSTTNPEKHIRNVAASIYHFSPTYDQPLETYKRFRIYFQSHFTYLLEQLAAPFSVPLMFASFQRNDVSKIVNFVRDYSVNTAMGDVCEFTLFDMKISGKKIYADKMGNEIYVANDKMEVSLMAFARKNDKWEPPEESRKYLKSVNTETVMELSRMAAKEGEMKLSGMELYEDLNHLGMSPELFASIIYSRMRKSQLGED